MCSAAGISASAIPGHGSSFADALTPIWESLFNRFPIGADENFFDLGGDPSLATRLFVEIAKASGRQLPAVTIYQAPTISALASLLAQPEKARFCPLVLLKAGGEKPPIFIAHGLGASVMQLFQLVKHLEPGHPVYGLQAKGADGVSAPSDSIEESAIEYLNTIKYIQPHGPYLLIGYSLGGLVMFEIARRLAANCERVGLLAMVDSYPHERWLSLTQRVFLATQIARRRAWAAIRFCMRTLGLNRAETAKVELDHSGASSAGTAKKVVRDAAYSALKRYRPRPYEGEIKFVRAEVSTTFPGDPVPVWAHLAGDFDVDTVPGDHVAMLSAHSEALASALNRFLRLAPYDTSPRCI
jgi:acetoacetyl-CoA synthetase